MREQGGGKCRAKTEREKENIQEGSEKTQKKNTIYPENS